jgi:Uma2 family endonuclease
MSSLLLRGLEHLNLDIDDPEKRLIVEGVTWEQYEKLLVSWENQYRYRLTYVDGTLEIMSPSRKHEVSKKNIARLLEVYLEEAEIDFWGLGSTTLRNPDSQVGKEPDECFCIGTEKDLPDLAIEVVLTSGGIDSLKVYQRLGIPEVWFWQNNQLKVYLLNEIQEYIPSSKSRLFPDLDLKLFSQYVLMPNPRLAMTEFRQQLRIRK